jgi:hypothetical protein
MEKRLEGVKVEQAKDVKALNEMESKTNNKD